MRDSSSKEREGKVFACLLGVRKAFDTAWIDGLLYRLFSESGVDGKMFAMIKALYTDVEPLYILMVYRLRRFLYSRGLGRDAFWHL